MGDMDWDERGRQAREGLADLHFLVGSWEAALPYLLVAASSSFIYVAVADLLPQLQQRLSWRETLAQVAWIGGGLGLVLLARALMHAHAH